MKYLLFSLNHFIRQPMKSKRIKTAFILGAGLGTRLRPLTDHCPKPLLSIGSRPMITYAMDHLISFGIERFIVNTHHCASVYEEAFPDRRWRGTPIIFRYEPVLLETAGGLKNIEDLLHDEEPIIIYNGDIITDIPLGPLFDKHAASGKEATLALRSRGPVLNVDVDGEGEICDMRHLLGRPGVKSCLFTGIYLVEHRFLKRLVPGRIESVVPVFVRMIEEQPGAVANVVIDDGSWSDIGTPDEYEAVKKMMADR
jgi:mannose-1-phosphate guanylyltransferase